MRRVLLAGGTVVDGTGAAPLEADVVIHGETVEAVVPRGDVRPDSVDEIVRVDGCHVTPGFIDAHSHLDLALLHRGDAAAPLLFQGCTTAVVGQDGVSYAPVTDESWEFFVGYWAGICGPPPEWAAWRSVAEYLSALDGELAINVGYLTPHGNVRAAVLGVQARPASGTERAAMRRVVQQSMDDGALGVSTGLHYVPCLYADTTELVDVVRGAAGTVFVTHMRDYEQQIVEAIRESVEVGERAGVRVHISHLNGRAAQVLPVIDEAHERGVRISFDTYPYLAGTTTLTRSLPSWVVEGTVDEIVERLRDRAVRDELRPWFQDPGRRWSSKVISSVGRGPMRSYEGRSVADAIRDSTLDPTDLVCDLLVSARLEVSVLGFRHHRQDEGDIRELFRHPLHVAGSDGVYVGSNPHPRGWATFAEFLTIARDEGVLSLPEAVRHLTSAPAAVFGLHDRGVLTAGYRADIAVLRIDQVTATATYEAGRALATGVEHVFGNGTPVVSNGRATGATPGTALTRGT